MNHFNDWGQVSTGIMKNPGEQLNILEKELKNAEYILIGAGSGLSTAAGFTYSGERFHAYFFDFEEKFGISDMYAGGFYPFPDEETRWAWWSRHIYYNRYVPAPTDLYGQLLNLVKEKDYFVLTTNVDHQFQRAGFDKKRLFYTQGDYGLFQSINPHIRKTYDNEKWVEKAMAAQGFIKDKEGIFQVPEGKNVSMRLPEELIPRCPDDDGSMTLNLRCDDSFVEDEGWYEALERYHQFTGKIQNSHVLYLELGVGMNTPGIIKFPFWEAVRKNKIAFYACLNFGEALCPARISSRSLCINRDMAEVIFLLGGIKK